MAKLPEFVAASFHVIRDARPNLACACPDVILQVPARNPPIERGIAGRSLLSHVMVAKFAGHVPMYR